MIVESLLSCAISIIFIHCQRRLRNDRCSHHPTRGRGVLPVENRMKVETYKCDQCGKQKQDSNHWFMLDIGIVGFHLFIWDNANADIAGYKHLCSQGCASKILSTWMTKAARDAEDLLWACT
jgi:hypothetical protein